MHTVYINTYYCPNHICYSYIFFFLSHHWTRPVLERHASLHGGEGKDLNLNSFPHLLDRNRVIYNYCRTEKKYVHFLRNECSYKSQYTSLAGNFSLFIQPLYVGIENWISFFFLNSFLDTSRTCSILHKTVNQ